MNLNQDKRIVMTLDAGGTNFRFLAMRGNQPVTATVAMPSNGDHLDRCLANIVEGFTQIKKQCPKPPVAISFAFPGPADYPAGIIGDLFRIYTFTLREGAGFQWVTIGRDVNLYGAETFDPAKMRELYEIGYKAALSGPQWIEGPPGAVNRNPESASP